MAGQSRGLLSQCEEGTVFRLVSSSLVPLAIPGITANTLMVVGRRHPTSHEERKGIEVHYTTVKQGRPMFHTIKLADHAIEFVMSPRDASMYFLQARGLLAEFAHLIEGEDSHDPYIVVIETEGWIKGMGAVYTQVRDWLNIFLPIRPPK